MSGKLAAGLPPKAPPPRCQAGHRPIAARRAGDPGQWGASAPGRKRRGVV